MTDVYLESEINVSSSTVMIWLSRLRTQLTELKKIYRNRMILWSGAIIHPQMSLFLLHVHRLILLFNNVIGIMCLGSIKIPKKEYLILVSTASTGGSKPDICHLKFSMCVKQLLWVPVPIYKYQVCKIDKYQISKIDKYHICKIDQYEVCKIDKYQVCNTVPQPRLSLRGTIRFSFPCEWSLVCLQDP